MSKLFVNKHGFYLLSTSTRKFLDLISGYTQKNNKKINLEKYKERVEGFIDELGLKEGDTWVAAHILFYLYKRWRETKRNPGLMSYKVFDNLLKLYFPHKITKTYGLSYRLDGSIRNLISAEELAQLRQGWERTNAKKKKSKK